MRARGSPLPEPEGRSVTALFPRGFEPEKGKALGAKTNSPPEIRRAAAGRAVSRVLFPALACLGWSSVWDGRRRPPLAAYPRLDVSVWVTPRRLFGLAPTGGYRATAVAGGAVGSYPTVSPLPNGCPVGGLFSVALSVAFRRPGVTWQSTRWSSDFPRDALQRPRPSRLTSRGNITGVREGG